MSNGSKLEDMPHQILAENIWLYVSPVLLLIGTVGNILVIIVLSRKQMRISTSSIYMICLAFSDLGVLYTGLPRQWLRRFGIWNDDSNEYVYTDLRAFTEAGCKFHIFMLYYFQHMSTYILICFSWERVIAVYFPFRLKEICTRLTVFLCLLSTAFLLLIFNGHFFWTYQLSIKKLLYPPFKEIRFCEPKDKDFRLLWRQIHMWAGSFVPFIIMALLNGLIIFRLCLLKHKSAVRSTRPVGPTSATVTLFIVTVVFLLLTAPMAHYYYYVAASKGLWYDVNDVRNLASRNLHFAIVNMLLYLNSAINFLLYSVSSSKFHKELTSLCCRQRSVETRATKAQCRALPTARLSHM
ncbi:unnamed protein product [Owenia fusiformis]|uniref:Uncharacterized protein n=1 Tax=Owenia fusiformis TaxID=6347 RepID=A0A8J1TFH4_OWEFU|nr:unnamed protein product [Owenia fusiformis]